MRLTFRDLTKKVNILNLDKQPRDFDDQTFKVNLIENLTSEHHEEIVLECEFELESEISNLDQIIDYVVHWASNPITLNLKPNNLIHLSTESTPSYRSQSPAKPSQVHLL